jgi:hypothetical protein
MEFASFKKKSLMLAGRMAKAFPDYEYLILAIAIA